MNTATPDVTFVEAKESFPPAIAGHGPPGASRSSTPMAMAISILIAIDNVGTRLFRNDPRPIADDTTRALPGDARAPARRPQSRATTTTTDAPICSCSATPGQAAHQKPDAHSRMPPARCRDPGGEMRGVRGRGSDGDLDIVTAGRAVQLSRNNGNGTFTDITAEAGLEGPGAAMAIAPRISTAAATSTCSSSVDGPAPALYRNMRNGSFRDSAEDMGCRGTSIFPRLRQAT